MKFPVKKDRIFVGIAISLVPIGVFLFVTSVAASGFLSFVIGLFAVAFLLTGSMLIWSLFHSYIELTEGYVINHFGPFQTQITLDRIREVRFIRDASLAFSWSFMRTQFWLFPQEVATIAMPKEEEEFLEALEQKLPSINTEESRILL